MRSACQTCSHMINSWFNQLSRVEVVISLIRAHSKQTDRYQARHNTLIPCNLSCHSEHNAWYTFHQIVLSENSIHTVGGRRWAVGGRQSMPTLGRSAKKITSRHLHCPIRGDSVILRFCIFISPSFLVWVL